MSDSDAISESSSSNRGVRVPNVDKNVLRKFIYHVESHNRNQEEQEMWKKHFTSKRTNLDRSKPDSSGSDYVQSKKSKKLKKEKKDKQEKKKRKKRKRIEEEPCDSNSSKAQSNIDKAVEEFLKPKVRKWGHDGYHEIYQDDSNSSSSSDNLERFVEKFGKRKRTKSKKKVQITSVASEDGDWNRSSAVSMSETRKYAKDKGEPHKGTFEKRKKSKKSKKSKSKRN